MTEKDSDTLAHEAEAARARFAGTAESLREKMSPGQIIDESMRYFRNSDGAVALDNLKTQLRDNPLPLALVGVGLGWFFLGGGPSSDRIARVANETRERSRTLTGRDGNREGDDLHVEDWQSGVGKRDFEEADTSTPSDGHGSGLSDTAHSAGEAISAGASSIGNAASSIGSAAAHAASGIGSSMSSARHNASSAMHGVRDRANRAGGSIQHRFSDVLDRDPLILGAIGVAVGAAVAAMLPRTETEDEYLGPYRDRVKDEAEKQLDRGKEEAADIVSTVVSSAAEEMKKEGLTTDGGPTVSERVASAAKSTAQKTEKKIRDDMGGKTGDEVDR